MVSKFRQSSLVLAGAGLIVAFFIVVGGVWQWLHGSHASSPSPTPSAVGLTTSPTATPSAAPIQASSPVFSPSPSAVAQSTYTGTYGATLEFNLSGHQACRRRIGALGKQMRTKAFKSKQWPDVESFPEESRVCPASRAAYDVFYVEDDVMLFCPGHRFKGHPSARWLRQNSWIELASPRTWHDLVGTAVLQTSSGHPELALNLCLRSYLKKKNGSALFAGLIAAADLDDRQRVSQIAGYADQLPRDVFAQLTRAHALGYLGRFADAEKICGRLAKLGPGMVVITGRVRGLSALAKGNSDAAVKQFSLTGRSFGWAPMWISFARKDFGRTLQLANSALVDLKYCHDSAIDWVRLAVISGIALGGEQEKLGLSLLSEGLRKCRRTWPYPVLLYLNREISEEELRRRAPRSNIEQVHIDVTVGTLKMVQKRDGRAELARANQPWSLDAYVAKAWLKLEK